MHERPSTKPVAVPGRRSAFVLRSAFREGHRITVRVHFDALVGEGATETAHAYTLTFSDNGTFVIEVDMHHERQGAVLATSHTIAWGSDNGVRTALLTFNTSLAWGDTVDLPPPLRGNDATDFRLNPPEH